MTMFLFGHGTSNMGLFGIMFYRFDVGITYLTIFIFFHGIGEFLVCFLGKEYFIQGAEEKTNRVSYVIFLSLALKGNVAGGFHDRHILGYRKTFTVYFLCLLKNVVYAVHICSCRSFLFGFEFGVNTFN